MTQYEIWSLWVNAIGVIAGLLVVIAALFGERIRQLWASPKLRIGLADPNSNITLSKVKGWYYLIRIKNERPSCPASNVRLLLTTVFKKGPDGSWLEQKFSGPTQVMWQWPDIMALYQTIGPDQLSTFGCLLENSKSIELKLYWYPNNLKREIPINEPTKLQFKAVSDTAESNCLSVEIAWDGKWVEDSNEIQTHCKVTESS